MSQTLNLLEARRETTLREYQSLVGDVECCGKVDLHVSWLEKQLQGIYEFAREETKKEMSVREIADLWGKAVQVCDVLIDCVRMLAHASQCPVSYDGLLDIRLKADAKAHFHRCGA